MSWRRLLHIAWTFLLLSCGHNKLDGKVQTIRLQYIAWACDCANWARPADMTKYGDAKSVDALADRCIFIEPADSSIKLPGEASEIELTGQFYQEKGFPKGYVSTEFPRPDKASVFRYTKYKVIRRLTP
ncbi:MAG TPA: hypothetical protein VIM64_01845 [Puia sp.]